MAKLPETVQNLPHIEALPPHVKEFRFTPVSERPIKRVVDMEILCLGLSRTGTNALRHALYELQYYDVHHMHGLREGVQGEAAQFTRAVEAKFEGKGEPLSKAEWDQLLGCYMAVTDMPSCCFAEELLAIYPNAKVILTVRDNVKQWHESVMETIFYAFRESFWMGRGILPAIYRACLPHTEDGMLRKKLLDDVFTWDFPTTGPEMYEEHNALIKSLVPDDQLLVFNVKDGWEPLCRFLGKPIPEKPFPKNNDRAYFKAFVARVRQDYERRKARAVKIASVGAVIVAVGFLTWQQYRSGR